ncbi:BTB/POZ domain-containing protein FBL11 isoform X3 [Physcomitrium patens]|uniref:BTB/POZ domain-containing protein FBL11 isoform X3 n=1 Tax=Physcomitrium patens TaxID=3218 RepID=UPI000D1705B6|nr:BTB/POZ domain-containing protein FBL11-like isoform X3 [Physcomitrium patens]|eukprot:XP_024398316.1 BTB/POZ domain-containing protein FBL11-like isoform X3 [Physcomitrella patens]
MEEDFSNSVVLVITEGDHDSRKRSLSREIDGQEMGCEEWQSLVADSFTLNEIRIRVDKELLSQHSTYFKGYLNFSERNCESLNVNWSLPIFCDLLRCIHGFEPCLSSSMIASLIEGAIYFGVEDVITKCKAWVASDTFCVKWKIEDDLVSELLSIWLSATVNGVKSIEQLCIKSLAVNFAQAMRQESFVTLPLSLLEASIDHPQLTIKSEMDLCKALLLWYESQKRNSRNGAVVDDPILLFKKIQLNLLPIDFILRELVGKYPLNIFHVSVAATESDVDVLNSIIDFKGELAAKPVKDYLNFKPVIRLTDHLKELDLSGCHQITCHHLISAAAQNGMKPKRIAQKTLVTIEQETWPELAEFINLETLILSHCWRVEQRNLVTWLNLVCPNLRELRAPHCPQLLQVILEIGSGLPNLSVLDLSVSEELVEIEGVVTRTKSTISQRLPLRWSFGKLHETNKLTDLSLRGHSEITDEILLFIARSCPLLRVVDLGGCLELSDVGFAAFLNFQENLAFQWNCWGVFHQKLSAAGTRFGPVSCKALISQANISVNVLDTLNLNKCLALGCGHLSNLLQVLPSLVSLELAFTRLDDMALSAFSGTSLRHLNIRETKVSGGVLYRILARNFDLKDLNIRGCTQLALNSFDHLPSEKTFERMWENVGIGWGLSDSTISSFGFASCTLQNFAVGVGGTISEETLLCIAEQCHELKRLSLCFQFVADEGLIQAVSQLKSLHTLELQNMACAPRNLLTEIASSLPNLRNLKLERVTPLLSDDDLLLFSQSCTGLQSLSLLGCHLLTSND